MEILRIDIFHFRFNQLTKHTRINYGYGRNEESSQKLEEGCPERCQKKKKVKGRVGVLIYFIINNS